ncbi:MAG: hypothetical protein H6R10_1156 [Rhodocyclaceae bacterium]|nr:hypothetical protein [Rhodocyclaceae bacterium]
MKISHKIRLVIFLSIALGLALALTFLLAQRRIDSAVAQGRQLSLLTAEIFQLTLLGQDVALHPEELRAPNQWLKQHRELGELLYRVRLDDPQDGAVLEKLREAHGYQLRLFEDLQLLSRQQKESGATAIGRERLERLAYRMSFSAQSMLSNALALEQRKRGEISGYRREIDRIALGLAGIMTSVIAALAYLIGRSITLPLARLRRETEIIGAGNLGHRVGTADNDELGDLSRDFDRMLDRLQAVTASREDLQHEVEARIRVEQALRESERSLKKAQAIARMGSWEWDIPSGRLRWSDETYRIFGRQPGHDSPSHEAFLDTVHPDDRPLVARSMEGALRGENYDIEHRIRLPGGEVRVVHQIGEVEFDDAGKPVKMLGTVHDPSGRPVRMLGTVHDITERKRAEDELRRANERLGAQLMEIERLRAILQEQAIHDPLTGLFNRRYMEETLAREFAGAERENYPVSLVMVDIDHFKRVNDTYGHQAGDMVLTDLSETLSGHIRGRDIACRYGGEEFLAVLPHTPIEVAAHRAELWRASFEALELEYEGQTFRATISLGVAAFPAHGTTSQAVLAAADKALYAAKAGGRNRIVVAD